MIPKLLNYQSPFSGCELEFVAVDDGGMIQITSETSETVNLDVSDIFWLVEALNTVIDVAHIQEIEDSEEDVMDVRENGNGVDIPRVAGNA